MSGTNGWNTFNDTINPDNMINTLFTTLFKPLTSVKSQPDKNLRYRKWTHSVSSNQTGTIKWPRKKMCVCVCVYIYKYIYFTFPYKYIAKALLYTRVVFAAESSNGYILLYCYHPAKHTPLTITHVIFMFNATCCAIQLRQVQAVCTLYLLFDLEP